MFHGPWKVSNPSVVRDAHLTLGEKKNSLVPTGSEKYPYNGALDKIGRRCFANDTCTVTGTDHKAYKVETAGGEGFCQILPVYIDHILYPTLTEAAFITWVDMSCSGKFLWLRETFPCIGSSCQWQR